MDDLTGVEDLKIWKESALEMEREAGPSSQWYFSQGSLRICDSEKIIAIPVDRQVESVLALFDMMYTFWKIGPSLAEHDTLALYFRRMDKYHSILHQKVTHMLKSVDPRKPLATTPQLLGPWLNRTLLLYTHDDDSREKLKGSMNLGGFLWMFHLNTSSTLFQRCLRFSPNPGFRRTRTSFVNS